MKVLEKVYGHDKAEEFIRGFGNDPKAGNGFGFQDGFDVRIVNGPEGQKVVLQGINGFSDIELTPDLLISIIADAEQLDARIESKKV